MTLLGRAQDFGLDIAPGILAKKLVEENGRITAVECLDLKPQETFTLSSKIVIVSGGAIHSPALLLRSNLDQYDHHRFIGSYLMRHCSAVVSSFFPFKTKAGQVFHKQVGINSFYEDFREELGTAVGVIQDIYSPPAEAIVHCAPRGLKSIAGSLCAHMQNLLCIAEDSPCHKNRVSLSDQQDLNGLARIKVTHRYHPDDYRRRKYLTTRARRILTKAGGMAHITVPLPTLSHATGTVRFGPTPDRSVLDRNCRFHGIDNLFVLDGSFMPTSAGVNPSLTIAANALRVSDHIISTSDQSIDRQFTYQEFPVLGLYSWHEFRAPQYKHS
jgi:choline dehydrogenase-like flavoprotein